MNYLRGAGLLKRLTITLLLAVFFANIASLSLPQSTKAANRVGPMAQMSYLVSKDKYADVRTTYVNIYSKNPTIDVFVTSADLCDGDAYYIDDQKDLVKADGANTYLGNGANGDPAIGRNVTKFTVNGASQTGIRRGDNSCNNNDHNQTSPVKTHAPAPNASRAGMTIAATTRIFSTTSNTKLEGSTDVFVHKLEAKVSDGVLNNCAENCMVNLFKVYALNAGNGTNWGSADNIWVTQPAGSIISGGICGGMTFCRLGDVNPAEVGIQASISGGGGYTDIEAEFAPDCNFPDDGNVSMLLYDDDNRPGPGNGAQIGPQFRVRLEALPRRNDNNYRWSDASVVNVQMNDISSNSNYPPSAGGNIGSPNFTKSKVNDWLFMGNVNSKKYITVNFKMNKNNVYRLRINDIYRGNIIQYTLPFASVWADDNVWKTRTCADWRVSGTTTVDKSSVEVGDPAHFTHALRNNGSDPTPNSTPYAIHLELREMDNTHIAYLPPSGIAGGYAPVLNGGQSYNVPDDPDFTYIGQAAHVGKKVCQKLYIANHRPGSTDYATSEKCVEVIEPAFQPYFRVWGGDVEAGFGPGIEACIDSSAQIAGWNRGSPNNNASHPGAGGQFGVQAMDVIRGFASAQYVLNRSGYPHDGTGLTFANDSASKVGADVYGGKFNNVPNCKDYTDGLTVTDNGDTTIGTTNVGLNTSTVKYVKGDVYISGDVAYTSSGYSLGSMPSFKLIVEGGNIYIGSGVSRLDGLYVAQKDAEGQGGKIYTCASGIRTPVPADAIFANCQTQLTVNGAFVADRVVLLRTFGDAGELSLDGSVVETRANNNAAERFIYSPEMWLGQSGGSRLGKPDSIISLPPVL